MRPLPRKPSQTKAQLGTYTPGYRLKWNQPSWIDLPRTAKGLYSQLSENPSISAAGVLMCDPVALAEAHPDCTPEDIEQDLDILEKREYIARSGMWLFMLDWFRNNRSTRNPNHLIPILNDIDRIGRRDLRLRAISALLKDIEESARLGEPLSNDVIIRLDLFTTRYEIPLPEAIRDAKSPQRSPSRQRAKMRAVQGGAG